MSEFYNLLIKIYIASRDLCNYARLMNIGVSSKFNGITLECFPDDSPKDLVKYYFEELRK